MSPAVVIRVASADEAEALHALSVRSKAHWGYDAAFMALAAAALVLRADWIAAGRVRVAESGGAPVGVAAILAPDAAGVAELEHLFVDPGAMGRGVGAALLADVVALAEGEGARTVRVLSDPQARGFYERHGFGWRHDAPSDAIPGRMLPVLLRPLRVPAE
jgi:GNAT superfamily N-acetyltransferase